MGASVKEIAAYVRPRFDFTTEKEKREMIEAKELFLGLSGKFWEAVKITLLCIVIFLGAAFTIMAFNNDISIKGVFEQLYSQFTGRKKPTVSELADKLDVSEEEILEALRQAIYAKPQGHAFEISPANFPMSAIGG